MRKINTKDIAEEFYSSPKGKFGGGDKEISIALGRKPQSTDLMERHPFDVEICRIPSGMAICPYHSHSMQWEFYHVLSGNGLVRHQDGTTEIEPGDAFIAKLSPAGQLLYLTYLGGNGDDSAFSIAVDSSGNAFVTGFTTSADFPTNKPVQPHLGGCASSGCTNAFITG